ncbi:MAG: hypothetical protein GY764_00230, partial [Halieaceae bacterium]|nr:hypothetical protein [Halieaceae bacterium]
MNQTVFTRYQVRGRSVRWFHWINVLCKRLAKYTYETSTDLLMMLASSINKQRTFMAASLSKREVKRQR